MRTTFKHVVDIIIDTVEWCIVISSYYKNPYKQYQNVCYIRNTYMEIAYGNIY